ncbi:MAG: hypothetical protein ABS917_11255 [Solibacillus sp.]|uniref:hypothetical protein n=1 Tax=Solibacillus sp. TaxID=1909654 RepID=UPI0033148146
MPKTMFCYEVHSDAGLANDRVTGKNVPAYLNMEFELGRTLSEEEYNIVHTVEAMDLMANQLKLNKDHLKPISVEEFFEKSV